MYTRTGRTRTAFFRVFSILLCALSLFIAAPGCVSAAERPAGYIKTIRYSNLNDKAARCSVKNALKKAGVPNSAVNSVLANARDYNKTIRSAGLVKKGFKTTKNLAPSYPVGKIDALWAKKYPAFIGNNCRITAFTLMRHNICQKKIRTKDTYNTLFLDRDALGNHPNTTLKGSAKKAFLSFYRAIPAKDSTSARVQAKQVQKVLKSRGVSFRSGKKISLISVWMHANYGKDENYLFVGHTGVLMPYKNKLLFLEKLSFEEPYQAMIFSNRTALNDYLMRKYDVSTDPNSAPPFITENARLISGYRRNPAQTSAG